MKLHFVALLALAVLPISTFSQDVNFDDLRRAGAPLVKSYTISGAGVEGSSAIMKFGDVDTRRVEGHNAQRRAYAASGVIPPSAPTWAIVNKESYFEVKCSNRSHTYSVYACGNMGLFDNRGHYREGMGGCFYKSVEQAAQKLCTG